MPVYRPGPLVAEAIGSILCQTREVLEIIVVDDGSADDTAEIIIGMGIDNLRLIQQNNTGPAAARNMGLTHIRGDIVAFLDADDLWLPDKLERQLQLILGEPDAGIVIGNTSGFGEACGDRGKRFQTEWGSRQFLQLGSMLVRKTVFEEIGVFDAELQFAEDVDWYLRAREKGIKIVEHDDTVLKYRRHANNMTNDTSSRDRGFVGALKKKLDRKRSEQ